MEGGGASRRLEKGEEGTDCDTATRDLAVQVRIASLPPPTRAEVGQGPTPARKETNRGWRGVGCVVQYAVLHASSFSRPAAGSSSKSVLLASPQAYGIAVGFQESMVHGKVRQLMTYSRCPPNGSGGFRGKGPLATLVAGVLAAAFTGRVAAAEPTTTSTAAGESNATGAATVPAPAPPAPAPPAPAAPAPAPAGGEARLTITVEGEIGTIWLDGARVGEGAYSGTVAAGTHALRVSRPGYGEHVTTLTLAAGEVRSESLALTRSVGLAAYDPGAAVVPSSDGMYGGVHLLAAFVPSGAGTTFEDSCDRIGATRCDPGSSLGGGLSGFVGFMYSPVGLELAMLVSGDRVSPSARFDGETGSELNPVVASPARREAFDIYRVGGGGALRIRVVQDVSRFHFSFAAGPGFMYRFLGMTRETDAEDGRSGRYVDAGASYVSALLSLEAAASMRIGPTTALSLGLTSWIEHAGDKTRSEPENRTLLTGDQANQRPTPQATPPYDLANGPQWFLGPFVGLTFGL